MGLGFLRILTVAAVTALVSGVPLAAPDLGELTVNVTGIEAGLGAVRVNLYASAQSFLAHEAAQIEANVPLQGAPLLVFRGLQPGTYAVVAYYDRNQNGKLDRGVFGVPLEPLGFSNGVVPVLSRPGFAEAAFVVEAGKQGVDITLRSFARAPQAGS